jgi:peptidoglycan/xylan/chitin deacetylase (PgdA/CDA1 family)
MSWRRQFLNLIAQSEVVSSGALGTLHRGACVFMFHRVLEPNAVCYDAEMVTSTHLFSDLVQWLAKEFQIVPLHEIAERLRNGRSLRRLCALTFDDGWVDNYTNAFPILREIGVPATIFLASRFIGGTRRLWQERLWYVLQCVSETQLQSFAREWRAGTEIKLAPVNLDFAKWRSFLLGRGSKHAEEFVDALQSTVQAVSVPQERAFMNWDEVRQMQCAGIEFGAHTLNHVFLTTAPSETVRAEIEGSRREIKNEIGTEIPGFAYPWGASNGFVLDCVQQVGFKYAAGVCTGLVGSKSDTLLLPRIFMGDSVLGHGNDFSPSNMAVYLAVKAVVRGSTGKYE